MNWKKFFLSFLGCALCITIVIALLIGGFIAYLFFSSIPKVYSGTEHYHMIYDNVHNANKTFTKAGQKETLLSFGEYSYCSYLLLFPREQPKNLKEFEYYWSQGIDYDSYSVYFSYELDEEEYQTFRDGLSSFSIACDTISTDGVVKQINKPVYTEDLFEYPAYIFSWSKDTEEFGFCEYILLDDENHTVVNVFMVSSSLDNVQEKASYRILPKGNNQNAVEYLVGGITYLAKDDGYCIYAFRDGEQHMFIPKLSRLEYSLDFMPQP